jgi:glycosyltransferase involved in cell wall biosynthesis
MKKIANIVLNDFTNDSRVYKISQSLNGFNYITSVVAIHNHGLKEKEFINGVKVERIKLLSRPWPKWKWIQMIKYLEFVFRAFWRFRKVDIVHSNDLSALPVAVLIKFFGKNVKVVYDCHEYETEINGLKGIEKKAKKILEKCLVPFADKIITVSESIAGEYAQLYNISKPYLILNCPAYNKRSKSDLFRKNLSIGPEKTIFLYQGGLTKGRGIELLLEAFSDLVDDKNVLVLMGYGPLESLVKSKAEVSSNIFFHPAVEPSILLDYTSSADYGILFYEDTCLNHRYCSPNKIFEYLMAGLPVISSNLVEMKRLVEREGVGIVAQENTVQGFQSAIIDSLAQDYSAIRESVLKAREKFCWEEQEKVLKEIYHAL